MTIRVMVIMMMIMIMVMIMAVLVISGHDGSHQLMHVCGSYYMCNTRCAVRVTAVLRLKCGRGVTSNSKYGRELLKITHFLLKFHK